MIDEVTEWMPRYVRVCKLQRSRYDAEYRTGG